MDKLREFDKVSKALIDEEINGGFKFAKSMPEIPHAYTVRENWRSDEEFINAVKFIRENGYKEKFLDKEYIYLNVNGKKYWTMGEPINKDGKPYTVIINRAEL
ncbi:hypothetical protein QUF55_03360 [Clostridiaceae bacterium HSG29]|nr:hypothetical protein [Clostridiaceae bacterium HSG29]